MVPPVVAIGPWIYVALPLAVVIPIAMIALTRALAIRFGDDSFRLRK